MANFMTGLKNATNYTYTENGALSHKFTGSKLYDLFALGGAYRERSDADVINLFKQAFEENEPYAMKCLFYLRDVRGGAGERRFFRVCIKWLAKIHPEAVLRNFDYFAEFGRYDDYFCLFDTPLEKNVLRLIKHQLAIDVTSRTPSLLAKWLPSINTSSPVTVAYGNKVRNFLGLTHKQYRKMLSELRGRINVVEKLMSAGKWDEIEFDKIPSKAGMVYRNAFARRDMIAKKYEAFAKDTKTKVNAGTLYPYEVVEKARNLGYYTSLDNTERLMINKYWDNLTDYIHNGVFNGICVVDTSGSMYGTPINVALSLGMYCAEKAKGPYANHFITFSERPELIEFTGVDFVDKVQRAQRASWDMNTNLEAVFDLILGIAVKQHLPQDELPQNLVVISDQEFDAARGQYNRNQNVKTMMENIEQKWSAYGYKFPNLIFWNVNARHDLIPMKSKDGITFVSGFSPSLFQQIITGKTAFDLMYEVLNQSRYSVIM